MYAESMVVTFTGRKIDYRNFCIDDVSILDIAKGLSNECRFGGQCDVFYSVAQHSLLVSSIVPAHLALEALLHDASEAYLKDFPSPLKKILPEYSRLENKIDCKIREKFNISTVKSPEVKLADLIILATESRDLGMEAILDYPTLKGILPASNLDIAPLKPELAFSAFISKFNELTCYQYV